MKLPEFKIISAMAFRNLSRHRIKTIITATAIAVSVALYIFAASWMDGMNIESRRNIVLYEMGAAKIQTPAYFNKKDDLPMYESFGNWEEVADALEQKGFMSAPHFVFTGTLYSKTGTAPILMNAVDVQREKRVLRYPDFVEFGTFPKPGSRSIALGMSVAEKLHVGIPQLPGKDEYENEILASAVSEDEKNFIESLYVPYNASKQKKRLFVPEGHELNGDGRMSLRKDASYHELQQLWNILAATGRMDVRISTTIDIKALPDRIMQEKFERDVKPLYSNDDLELLMSVYEKDPVLGDYMLTGGDDEQRNRVLSVMLESDYNGAVRHVNQLIDAVVVGVINSPNPKTNANIGFMPISSLQDKAGLMLEGRATELLVRKADAKDAKLPGKEQSAEAIREALLATSVGQRFEGENPELDVYGWERYTADFFAAYNGDMVSTRIMVFMLFLLSFIGISNTMLMAILERTKEIGMMRALGMTDRQLVISYMMEAALVGLIGSAIGVLIGCLINIPMVEHGLDYSAVAEEMSGDYGYRIAAQFRSTWNIVTIIGSFVVATVLSGCMAVLPTLRALKMPVTDTLRFE